MTYKVILQPQADCDIKTHIKSGNTILVDKIECQLDELKLHPRLGTGKPHRLKHYKEEVWSRRIDDRHRMIYAVHDDVVTVFVISLWGHYDDK